MIAARLLPATLLLACATPAMAEVKDSSPMGFTVENSRVVPVAPQVAWDAMVDKVHLWWPRDHTWWGKEGRLTIRARVGGCFCEIVDKQQAQHMTVAFVDPPRTLRMVGGLGPLQGMGLNGALEFRLESAGEGSTKITLWYRAGGYTPDDMSKFAPTVDQVQALQLGGLADYLGAKDEPAP
jgi:uncharacterized protein YndB with AHSA1/START domain